MAQDAPGPLPTQLVFLSEIPNLSSGTKIRFLGCVSKYAVAKGVLTLESPPTADQHRSYGLARPAIDVNINLLLGSLSHSEVDIGSWINIVGYVRQLVPAPNTTRQYQLSRAGSKDKAPQSVYVEALMIIPAGGIRIGEYERVVSESRELYRRLKSSS
ncbi:predicted protein [Uncinocarpus reesii 1704]|uniref:CST complex subunit Ten1 n=1 Tax=Uncinocarpus reesii (strain UAMH 1704) TaxID=336963 RepID=C4JK26_UNCRE|nr:uncharacterized protein UREG_01983 [Uncinocarpus reesii 1704]EEP77134.1 predicted protein [Uncinocarpus reesii 1704]